MIECNVLAKRKADTNSCEISKDLSESLKAKCRNAMLSEKCARARIIVKDLSELLKATCRNAMF